MSIQVVANSLFRKSLLVAAAATALAALPATAIAGGGHGRHHARAHHYHHYSGYYPSRYYGGYYGYYAPRRHYYYGAHRHRGHLSGAEAAVITAGIIGGAILIDRALDNRDRYARYDDRRYDRYADRRYDDRYQRRGAVDDDYYYRRDDRSDADYDDRADGGRYARAESRRLPADQVYDEGAEFDDDSGLLGAAPPDGGFASAGSTPDGYMAQAAFRECVAETRGAAGAGGMLVAAPGAPGKVETLADGSLRMEASFRASNARGEEWTRRMICEADDQGVRFLQVD